MFKLIENWQDKNLKCHFCDSTKSVKYETEVFDPVVDSSKPTMVCICNRCVIKRLNTLRLGNKHMDIGYRIKYIRTLNGLTQKELGIAIGFDEKSADVRIAQYESGSRAPKEKTIRALALALKVEPKALTVPNFNSLDDIIHTLFAIEDEFKHEDMLQNTAFDNFLRVWKEKANELSIGSISKKEYDLWRYNYSAFDNK